MRRAALLLFLTLTFPLAAQRYALGEGELVPAGGERHTLRGASSDSGHLLVWEDGREYEDGYAGRVFAARLSAEGNVVDPAGIPIDGPYSLSHHVLGSDDSGYLLAGPTQVLRIDANGTTTAAADFPVVGLPLALAWNGSHYGLLYRDFDGFRFMAVSTATESSSAGSFPCGAASERPLWRRRGSVGW